MDIDKVMLILDRVETLGVAGKKIMADGKVNLADLPVVIALIPEVKKMIEAFQGAGEAFEEMKDIDPSEGIELLKKFYSIGKAIEQA